MFRSGVSGHSREPGIPIYLKNTDPLTPLSLVLENHRRGSSSTWDHQTPAKLPCKENMKSISSYEMNSVIKFPLCMSTNSTLSKFQQAKPELDKRPISQMHDDHESVSDVHRKPDLEMSAGWNSAQESSNKFSLEESEHDGGHAFLVPVGAGFMPYYEVATGNRFLSLASRPVEKFQADHKPRDVDESFALDCVRLSRWTGYPDQEDACLRWHMFYAGLSVLTELDSKVNRKVEKQLRNWIKAGSAPKAWRNRTELHDLLWLELQAWMRNTSMDHQDHYLMNEREKIDAILTQILSFRIDDTGICIDDGFGDIDQHYIHALHTAYKQVSGILHQLDDIEHLYPSTKRIGLSHATYDRPQFQDKVKALTMWSNSYIQLTYLLQAVTGIICGRKLSDVFPQLRTSMSETSDDTGATCGMADGVDGVGALTEDARSEFSSIFFHDLVQFGDPDREYAGSAIQAAIRIYVEKSMRKRGLEKTITQIKYLIFRTLHGVMGDFGQPVASVFWNGSDSAPEGRVDLDIVKLWNDIRRDSNLPYLGRVFAYMLRLPIQTLREGITLRLEQRPVADPDVASLSQLIHECRETLILAIQIKADYVEMGLSTIQHHQIVLGDIKQLDELMKKLLELYLEYLQQLVLSLEKATKASRLQQTVLEDEWKTMMIMCGGIDDAQLTMPKVFCAIVQRLLTGTGSLLDSGVDDFISSLYPVEKGSNRQMCPSKDMFRQFFRDGRSVFVEAKERCFKLLEFTKLLHKDLDIAAVYEVMSSGEDFLKALADTNHYEIEVATTTERDLKYRFFVPAGTASSTIQTARLLEAIMGGREQDAESGGYLLIVPAGPHKWTGRTIKIDAGAVAAIRHSHVELPVGHVMVVVLNSSVLAAQTERFEKSLPKDAVRAALPQTTCYQVISHDLDAIEKESLELGKKVCAVILRVQNQIRTEQFPDIFEYERSLLVKAFRELVHESYNFCIEYHRELSRVYFRDEEPLARQLFFVSRQWMDFVVIKCERGHGVRPRWSRTGLDYLTMAVWPRYTRYLTEDELLALKTQIDRCAKHVIGDEPGVRTPAERPSSAQFYVSLGLSSESDTFSWESWSKDDESDSCEPPRRRVADAVAKLDSKLAQKLLDRKAVGKVVPTAIVKNINHLKSRKVDFKWRLGGKLGSGRHADVYKVMNLDTGRPLAAKKIPVSQAIFDERVSKLATEIEWLAGLKHQNVVRYFGVEIHLDEVVLFMEYCDGGTLGDVALKGLDIMTVRGYTKQLLLGVAYLHENGICHLDIKGQNVFLTSGGQVKLGDFSEMVKLADTACTGTHDVSPLTGTIQYMSPEMIRGEEGSRIGRATDIWSLGCVVVEMVTRKMPKFDGDGNVCAVMFHVGSGGRPKVPDNLHRDCSDFLDRCFEKQPQNRWKAEKLLNHPFVTVDIGDVQT